MELPQKQLLGSAAMLMVALTAVYWNHFDNGFHFDDSHTIISNSYIRDLSNISLFFQDARTTSTLPPNQAYRPMVTCLNAIDLWLAGAMEPRVFHQHIFLEFLLLLMLFYFLLVKLFSMADGRKHRLVALLSTAFFAFHAATAETINYIIARSDGFSTLMVLAGMLIYVSASRWKKTLGLIPFVLGCLAKPTALMLAPLLFVYELLMEQPPVLVRNEKTTLVSKETDAFKKTGVYFLIGICMYFFTQSMASETALSMSHASATDYLITQMAVIAFYLRIFLIPTGLSADSDMKLLHSVDATVIVGVLIILSLILVGYLAARKKETLPISFGILWFFIALAPTSSIVPQDDVMNHHRTFFPYLGLTIALGWSVRLVFAKLTDNLPSALARSVLATTVFIVIGANAFGTYERNEVWDNEESLWKDVAEKSPNNGRGLMAYGMQLLQKGDNEGALKYLEKASKTSFGTHPYLVANLARCYAALGQNDLAKQYFELSLTGGDNFPECHYHYAIWLAAQGDLQMAHQQISKLLQISPSHGDAKRIRDALEAEMTKRAEQKSIQEAAEKYVALSLQYYHAGRFSECVVLCQKAIELRPDYADAYNNMCSAYNELKQYELAVKACEKALSIKPDFELAKNNLNWSKHQLKQ